MDELRQIGVARVESRSHLVEGSRCVVVNGVESGEVGSVVELGQIRAAEVES